MRVLVSGCYDLIHAGHVEFLRRAAEYGEVTVSLGSDETIAELKGRPPLLSRDERLYLVRAIRYVTDAFVATGSGVLDFQPALEQSPPDVFVVNHDGDSPAKRRLCERLGVKYVVLDRSPADGLPARCSTELKAQRGIPYRIDLAGGWLDQPCVSCLYPGSVVVVSVWPGEYAERSGMATSARKAAEELWGPCLPAGEPEHLAKMLFKWENGPDKRPISGSQDHLGVCLPGISRLSYRDGYWPEAIDSIRSWDTCRWLEDRLRLVPLWPRAEGFDPLAGANINATDVHLLARAADETWWAIQRRDEEELGRAVLTGFHAQTGMFPAMTNVAISNRIAEYTGCSYGWKLTGAGGGGYILFVTQPESEIGEKVTIRR